MAANQYFDELTSALEDLRVRNVPFDLVLRTGGHIRVEHPSNVLVEMANNSLTVGSTTYDFSDVVGLLEYSYDSILLAKEWDSTRGTTPFGELDISFRIRMYRCGERPEEPSSLFPKSRVQLEHEFDESLRKMGLDVAWWHDRRQMHYQQQQQQRDMRQVQQQQQQQQIRPMEIHYVSLPYQTAIYVDWKHLAALNGGLKSFGISHGFGFSIGWQKAQFSRLNRIMSKRTAELADARVHRSAIFSAYAETIGGDITPMEMEGTKWSPILLLVRPLRAGESVEAVGWLLAYLRDDCAMLPVSLWEMIDHPVQILADVVTACVDTQFGTTTCFLKIRAAGNFALTSISGVRSGLSSNAAKP